MSDVIDPLELAAVRRVMWALADDEPNDDNTLMDAADAAVDRVEQLENRVSELEELVDPDPGNVAYEQLDKSQKVHRVRKKLAEKANGSRGGKARMTYKDVMWLFDGHPSTGHCYELMQCAARLDGYAYDKAGDNGEKRVRVNLEDVNDETLVHAVKDGATETPA